MNEAVYFESENNQCSAVIVLTPADYQTDGHSIEVDIDRVESVEPALVPS